MSGLFRRMPGLFIEAEGHQFVVRGDGGKEIARLDKVRASLWQLCDGEGDAFALTQRLNRILGTAIDVERVFEMLDELTDDGLMAARATPPASPVAVGRRRFLGAALLGVGLVSSAMTSAALAADAANAEEKEKRDARHDAAKHEKAEEKNLKQAERDEKHAG